jgi:hypothetical protein
MIECTLRWWISTAQYCTKSNKNKWQTNGFSTTVCQQSFFKLISLVVEKIEFKLGRYILDHPVQRFIPVNFDGWYVPLVFFI